MTPPRYIFAAFALVVALSSAAVWQWGGVRDAPPRPAPPILPATPRRSAAAIFAKGVLVAAPLPSVAPRASAAADPVAAPASKAKAARLTAAPSERLAAVLGRLADRSYFVRHSSLQALPADLTAPEIEALQKFLLSRGFHGLTAEQSRTLKNDLLNALRRQANPPSGLDETLITIYRDPSQELGMRDYAVQHLSTWYGRADAARQPEIRRALLDALEEKDSSIAGTALVSLYHLSQENHPEIDRAALSAAALSTASDPAVGQFARISAVQVCGQLHESGLQPVALSLASGNSVSIPLRIAAIAALGDVGGAENIAPLESWASGSEERLHLPARAALQRLKSRLGL